MEIVKIAAVMACHNRRAKTLASLKAFFAQEGAFDLQAVLLDDGSTDGTAAAVSGAFPSLTLLRGDGSFYWNRGMAAAFSRAMEGDANFFLWLNDDTTLSPGAIQVLLETSRLAGSEGRPALVAGSTKDPRSGRVSYGGLRRASRWHGGKFMAVAPSSGFQPCDAMNGNIVLIPAAAARTIGGIDDRFSHAMGDIDYGLRARSHGIPLVVAPGFQGECERNPAGSEWDRAGTPSARLKRARAPKGLPPGEWAYFLRKHGGRLWPLAWLTTYRRILTGS